MARILGKETLKKTLVPLRIEKKRNCAVCGCPIKRVYKTDKLYVDPNEFLCEFHTRVVNLIMDGFKQIKGTSNCKYGPSSEFDRGGWTEFIKNNLEVLIEDFEFNHNKRFYRPPSDYYRFKGNRVFT